MTDRSDVGGVPRLPGPNLATTSSPGLATAAAAPPPSVPVPADDPNGFALVLQRMAGELFNGSSVIPAPTPGDVMGGQGAAMPGSPGISPQLVPNASTGAGLPTDPVTPSVTAMPASDREQLPASSSARVPSAGGATQSSVPPTGDMVPGGGMPPAAGLPSGVASSPWGLPSGLGSPSGVSAPTNGASAAWASPDGERSPAHGQPSGAPRNGASSQRSQPRANSTITPDRSDAVTPGATSVSPPTSAGDRHGTAANTRSAPQPGSPFDAFELPRFGDDAIPDAFRLPMFDDTVSDGSVPYFMPDADARSIDSPSHSGDSPGIVESSEPRRHDDSPIRRQGGTAFDPYAIRKDFPILEERVHGNKRLVWLDNAATTQKPRAVIDRLTHFYEHENSNVHRAAHTLAARATDAFESARETTRKFLNAPSISEIVFVRGATEGINLIAQSWGRRNVEAGDEIVLTHLEHHANIVPWQMLCAQTGARLRIAPVDDRGDVILEEYEKLFNSRTKLAAFTQVSNALGTITPAREMIEIAHRYGALVMLDGAQAVSHMHVDVQQLDCDFYVFSGHKVFAPTGIGAVFGKREILDAMPPWQGGGNMIQDVTFERTTYNPPPGRFEAGTGNIADAAGLGAALDYVMKIGMNQIDRYEHELLVYATEHLTRVPGLRMIGTSPHKAGVLSFVLDGQRTEDVGAALDKEGIAVRSGHHCAQPILRRFGLESSVRASLAFYNICEDIDALVDAVMRLQSHRRSV